MKINKDIKRILITVAGVFFLILGVIGLVLPILQGILFILVGLALVSASSPQFNRWSHEKLKRSRKLHALFHKVEKWLAGIIGEV